MTGAGFRGDGSSIFIKSSQHCFHWPACERTPVNKDHTALHLRERLMDLTHVVEMLPEGLHPPVCVLSAVGGQCVCDLFTSVLVTDADTLRFTVLVFV